MIALVVGDKIKCFDCYSLKEKLKSIGFTFNKDDKSWEIPYSLHVERTIQGLGIEVVKQKKPSKELVEYLKQRHPEAFDHQIEAASLSIKEKSFFIGDEPGVGKTFTALIYADYLLLNNLVDVVFILCPASIKRQWQQEVNRWLNQTAYVINGTKEQRRKTFLAIKNAKKRIVIFNYELLLVDDVFKFLNSFENFAIVIDEASRVKNPSTMTFKKLYHLSKKTHYKLAMTGTPIENSLQEFWAIGYLLREFMSRQEFETNYVYYTEIKPKNLKFPIKKIAGYKNLKSFIAKISPFYIRRKKTDIKQMPLLTEYTLEIDQTPLQAKLERNIIETAITIENTIETLGRVSLLRLVADDPRLLLTSESPYASAVAKEFEEEIRGIKKNLKIDETKEILKEHSDKKVIILTQFKKMANMIFNEFKDDAILITGDDSNDQKAKKVGIFKSRDYRILIGTDALTYGISIDEADVLINFDIPWSVGKIIQRRDRIYRISSTKPKWVYYLVSNGIEKKVWNILAQKRKMFNEVVDGEIYGDLKEEILAVIKTV